LGHFTLDRRRRQAGCTIAHSRRKLWTDLANDDAAIAYAALGKFLQAPKVSVSFLGKNLKPVQSGKLKQITQWIGVLDSSRYAEREQAMANLSKAGVTVLPALEKVLAGKPTLEVRLRVELLLSKLENQSRPVNRFKLCVPWNSWKCSALRKPLACSSRSPAANRMPGWRKKPRHRLSG